MTKILRRVVRDLESIINHFQIALEPGLDQLIVFYATLMVAATRDSDSDDEHEVPTLATPSKAHVRPKDEQKVDDTALLEIPMTRSTKNNPSHVSVICDRF